MTRFQLRPGVRRLFRLPLRTMEAIHADADDELESLIASRVDDLIARGASPAVARAEALARLGASLDDARHQLHQSAEYREHRMRFRERIENLAQDIRYAARGLARRPAFTAVAVTTLAVGIGATTAIFSAVNALLLRPLPFPRADELMSVTLVSPDNGSRKGTDRMVWSYPKFTAFRDAQAIFSSLAVYSGTQVSLTSGDVELIRGEYVGATYLRTLGLTLARGRDFDPGLDAAPGASRQAIISYALWQRRFNLDPAIIGATIDVNREPYAVVGITPSEFRGLTGQAEVFLPVTTRAADDLGQAQSHEFSLAARRKTGVSVAQAASTTNVLGQRVNAAFPDRFIGTAKWGAKAQPLDATRVAPVIRRSVLILFGAVGLVLLIACVNVANLLLGRASARRREIAVRLAIGAGRRRLVQLLLTESLLLALIGGGASVVVAWLGTRALSGVNPAALGLQQRGSALGTVTFESIRLDWTALAFTFGATLLVGLLFGLVPALGATRASLSDALKDGSGDGSRIRGEHAGTGRRILVVTEVALALILLTASGLMVRSLGNLLAVDQGFDGRNVLTVRMTIPPGALARDSMPGFYSELLNRLTALPGVASVAIGDCAPLSGGCNSTLIDLKDRPKVDFAHMPGVGVFWTTPDWFATMRVPLKRGRLLGATDRAGMPKVLLVNETAARKLWPGEDAIGKRVGIGQGGFNDGAEVVGIVGDVRQWPDSAPRSDVYLSYAQSPNPRMILFVRTTGDPSALGPTLRATIHDVAPQYPIYDMQPMTVRTAAAMARTRFSALLLGLFALTALLLSAVGIYGVMALAVSARTREIGIRIALGADRGRVQRLVVGEGVALASIGTIVGLAGALLSTRVLRSLLFDLTPSDPITYVTIVAVLGAAAIAASWIPARRASRVDPVVALRAE